MQSASNSHLETERLGKLIRKYAFPCVISMLVAALYNIVDQIFIANAPYLGSHGNAANTVVFPMTVIVIAIAVMIGDGCCTFFSISLGSKNDEDAGCSVGNSVVLTIGASLVLAAIYLAFSDQILTLFGARVNDETFRLSKEYFFTISLGIPFFMFGQTMNPIIRADGSPKFAMTSLLTGVIFNIIFDPICINMLHWGMTGAALATVGGQFLSAAIGAAYLFKMKAVSLNKKCFILKRRLVAKILALGFASFIAQFTIVLSFGATITMTVKYGALDAVFCQPEYSQLPTAIIGISSKFFQIAISISVGIAAGCIPIAGYNHGAGRNDRVLGLMNRLIALEALIGLVSSAIFLLLPRQLMSLFGAGNESSYYMEFAVWVIRGQLCLLPLACVNKACFIFLPSLGKAKESCILSFAREFVFGVGFVLLLPTLWGLYALPFAIPAGDIATFIPVAAVLMHLRRGLKRSGRFAEIEAESEKSALAEGQAQTHTIITIGRSYGAGGRSVGRQVAERLKIPYYDAALLEEAARRSGLSQKYLAGMDEKPISINQLYQYPGFLSHRGKSIAEANKAQQEVIEMVAEQGPCVIVGRRADQILKKYPNRLSVFITAPKASRIERVTARDHLSPKDSAAKIVAVDRERAAYYRQFSDRRWGDAASYDICIDTEQLGINGSVATILTAVKILDARQSASA